MLWRGLFGGGAASGKVGALVASHNSGGQYVRARTTPTNPRSVFQNAVRDAVKAISTAWSTLTEEQRAAWKVYGTNTTFRNRIGDTIKLSGIACFVRSNTSRLQAGLTLVSDAPTVFDTGAVQSTPFAFVFDATNGTLGIDTLGSWIADATGSENTMLMYLSRPQNPGVNFFNGPYQLAGTLSSNATSPEFSVTLPFPSNPDVAQKIFGQVRVTRGDGRLSPTFQFQNTEGG